MTKIIKNHQNPKKIIKCEKETKNAEQCVEYHGNNKKLLIISKIMKNHHTHEKSQSHEKSLKNTKNAKKCRKCEKYHENDLKKCLK